MRFHSFLVTVASSLLWSTAQTDEEFTNLFYARFDNLGGSCSFPGLGRLKKIRAEARTLASDLKNLVLTYRKKDEAAESEVVEIEAAERLIQAYFFNAERHEFITEEGLQTIQTNGDNYADWLEDGGSTNDGNKPLTPVLMCNDLYRQRKSEYDILFDKHGEPDKDPTTGQPKFIYQDWDIKRKLISYQNYLNKRAQDGDADPETAVPYWIPEFGVYMVEEDYDQDPYQACSEEYGSVAQIDHNYPGFDLFLICPGLFNSPNEDPTLELAPFLDQTPVVPVQARDIENREHPYQAITGLRCPGSVFFHELMHLVLGQPKTKPPGGEIYFIWDILDASTEDSLVNAETYALAALA